MTTATTAIANKKQAVNLDKAIVVYSSDGTTIKRIKTQMKLSARDGSLVKILPAKKAWGDRPAEHATFIPTATAYMGMAAKCGLAVRHPDKVTVGGIEQPNGYCDDRGTYYFRSQAGGYTANGQPFITDRTVDFNVHRYNIQDLLAKAKIDSNAKYFKVMPFKGKDKDGAILGAPKDGDWAGYQIDEAVVLWVNCEAPEFVKWLGEMNNRIKNAIRVAQTFADRNAISSHPALPMQKKFQLPGDPKGIEAIVECVSWYATKGQMTFKALEQGGTVEVDVAASSITEETEPGKVIDATIASEATDSSDAEQVEDTPDDEPEGSADAPASDEQEPQDDHEPEEQPEDDGKMSVTGTVSDVTVKEGVTKSGKNKGKPWTSYNVTVDGVRYSTFDKGMADRATELRGQKAIVKYVENGQYKNLDSIMAAPTRKAEAPKPGKTIPTPEDPDDDNLPFGQSPAPATVESVRDMEKRLGEKIVAKAHKALGMASDVQLEDLPQEFLQQLSDLYRTM